jgi:hypothetical protein
MTKSKGPKRLNVINPGFDRHGLDSPSGPDMPVHIFLSPTPQGKLEDSVWPTLQWWEAPLQAEAGIRALSTRPFLHLTRANEQSANVSAHQLYPTALDPSDDAQVKAAAQSIAAYMRQGRELYMAAGSAGVTDLSTPLLYYYGALALAKAATTAIFGAWDQAREQHGLRHDVQNKPTSGHPEGLGWPTVIVWRENGMFKRFYQAARWDEVWQKWPKLGLPTHPQFHVLECLRYPTSSSTWGILPPTGFARAGFPPAPDFRSQRHPRETCLLVYQPGGDLFMHSTTPPDVPVFQLPNVVVQFMLLHYFSTLARYYTVDWQTLLGGVTEPEGYVFRVAFQQMAGEFLREVKNMLPLPDDPTMAPPSAPSLPSSLPARWLDAWYIWPEEPAP